MSDNVNIKDAVKKYGDFTAVNGVNLNIKEGELFTLLGPSGCGKTTLLRMIAGFNAIDGGEIYFGERLMNRVDAHKRDAGMVFQNYAIFPHLTVYDNVAYGLKAKKVPRDQIKIRVEKALEMVQITDLKDRKPAELSGGQQQRVALARAFVIEPGVLLMDEPLSNLDAKLRVQMRTIIRKLQRDLGITTIYVTHDQEEALAISDNIAIMKDGDIMQIGTPEEIYKNPQNTFVASFIGTSSFMDGTVKIIEGDKMGEVSLGKHLTFTISLKEKYEGPVIISARPEQLLFSDQGIPGEIVLATFLGDFINYEVRLEDGETIEVNEYTKDVDVARKAGEKIKVSFDTNKIGVYNGNSQEVISC